jgi:hypothetical protein
MTTPILVLGMNRAGTKLVSFLIAEVLGLRRLSLEPFSWEGGIDAAWPVAWPTQLRRRSPSHCGRQEHLRLPVFCDKTAHSPWLRKVLQGQGWDLVKFVECGRTKLYHCISPKSIQVGLIRNPVTLLGSLAGTTFQKQYCAEQWRRASIEAPIADPLPDAEEYLNQDLADCARLYAVFYSQLSEDLAQGSLRVRYESLWQSYDWLQTVADRSGLKPNSAAVMETTSQIGLSSQVPLSTKARTYVERHLEPIYNAFVPVNRCVM